MADDKAIVQKIEGARANDSFGLVTPNALHHQLNTLTADDWKQASAIYSKTNAGPDGFYIADDNGHVTIHNDLHRAQQLTDQGVLGATWDDAKTVGKWALGAAFAGAAGLGALGLGQGLVLGAATVDSVGEGLIALETGILLAPVAATAATGAIAAVDLLRNYGRVQGAQNEIRTSSEISFDEK